MSARVWRHRKDGAYSLSRRERRDAAFYRAMAHPTSRSTRRLVRRQPWLAVFLPITAYPQVPFHFSMYPPGQPAPKEPS